MNCDQFRERLDEWLDGELSSSEALAMRAHSAKCASCESIRSEAWAFEQFLGAQIGSQLSTDREQPFVARLQAQPSDSRLSNPRRRVFTTRSAFAVFATLAVTVALLVTVSRQMLGRREDRTVSRESSENRIVQLTRATGRVDVFQEHRGTWSELEQTEVSLSPNGTQLRTTDTSLCEIRLPNESLLRLAPSTEITIRAKDRLEVNRGRVWIRTAAEPMDLVFDEAIGPSETSSSESGKADGDARGLISLMRCPSQTTIQCEATPLEHVVQALESVELQAAHGALICSLETHDRIVASADRPDEPPLVQKSDEQGEFHPAIAWYWQLPLLALDTNDPDFLALLIKMLPEEQALTAKAAIGATKLDYFYDQEIRALGPRAAIPLLSFVQSEGSRETPARRLRAMRLACELADETARPYFIKLQQDSTTEIAQLAQEGPRHSKTKHR